MRYLLLLCTFFYTTLLLPQNNGARKIEPDHETSFDNYEVLIIAIVGLLLLIGLRFWFKRTRKH
jgi:hypothetical protein